jgi:hypothetical protein
MLTEPRTHTTLGARCPGCGGTYPGEGLPFLYADELGYRCPGCGSVLMVGDDGDPLENASSACRLVLSEGLEGSGLHEKLVELGGGGEGLELLVDRTGETRTVSLRRSRRRGPVRSRSVDQSKGGKMVTEERVRDQLRTVVDPELGMDLLELGLIYGVGVHDGGKHVTWPSA